MLKSYRVFLLVFILAVFFISGCSNGANPVIPPPDEIGSMPDDIPMNEDTLSQSDAVYLTGTTDDYSTYQGAWAIGLVSIDPETLKGEILPARNSRAIGDVFDADLTQYLIKNPCIDCLQMGQMNVTVDGNIVVEFIVRHPFSDINSRPDLHGFDVRGIVITEGTFEFSHTYVHLPDQTTEFAKGNINLLLNADGHTSHFDSLAENPKYFGSPRYYDGNINGYKRFFEDPTGGTFDPLNPVGHNVMKVGAGSYSAVYEFVPPPVGNIDFVLVIDVAYGQSAVFATRNSPKYFLPWFNRKEAWKLNYQIVTNELAEQDPQSFAIIRAWVTDWQAGLIADPEYPLSGLGTIPENSDVKRVTIEIPGVMGNVEIKSIPDGGNGSASDPYRFDFLINNNLGALAGTYKGIIAARDDLDATAGPGKVPEGPDGHPIEGPDLRDYAVYRVFEVEIGGGVNHAPIITTQPGSSENPTDEGSLTLLSVVAIDPDMDELTYSWQQVNPVTPQGIFEDNTQASTWWVAPQVLDTTNFTLTVTIDDGRGGVVLDGFVQVVLNVNRPPEIVSGPYAFPFTLIEEEHSDLQCSAEDPDDDPLTYLWVQVAPLSPIGEFSDSSSPFTTWTAPRVQSDTIFRFKIVVSDYQYAMESDLDIPVGAINEAPYGTVSTSVDPGAYQPLEAIELNALFTDPDGHDVVHYEWDKTYDGIDFNVNVDTGTIATLNTSLTNVGAYRMAVRGSDDSDPILSGIAACDVIIEGKWSNNLDVSDQTPPSTRIGSRSNQKAVVRDGYTVHVIYEYDTGSATELRLASSSNGGGSFDPSILIKSIPNAVAFESPTLCMNGSYVWAAWKEDNDVRFARSTDDGVSFESDYSLPPVNTTGDHIPSISFDSTSGNLFAVFADEDGSSNGILTLYKSINDGSSFVLQSPTITDNTADTNKADISCASNGDIFVSWIDERNSINGDAFYSLSNDSGGSFGVNRQLNLDYSFNGVDDLSMVTGQDNEAYFTWIDNRSGFLRAYFAKTLSGGAGVAQNVNVAPAFLNAHRNPQIFVNDFGRIYISFDYAAAAGHKIMLSSADYAGGSFDVSPIVMNDIVTSSVASPNCDLAGSIHPTGLADDVLVVWTDFSNGESSGFGDVFAQHLLWGAY